MLMVLFIIPWLTNESHLIWLLSVPVQGFPLVPVSIHAVARKKYFDDKWVMSQELLQINRRYLHMCWTVCGRVRACRSAHVCFRMCVCMCILGGREYWLICFSFCSCWMSVETHLLYAVHGPIVAALLVSLQTDGYNFHWKFHTFYIGVNFQGADLYITIFFLPFCRWTFSSYWIS